MISTHVAFKKLVSKGTNEDLAEAVTEIIDERQDSLVTKGDIAVLKNNIDNIKDKIENSLNWAKGLGIACLICLIKIMFYK